MARRDKFSEMRDRIEEIRKKSFDDRQNAAVDAILDEWNSSGPYDFVFPLIDGPPGTGKTTLAAVAIAEHLLDNPSGCVAYLCYTNYAAMMGQQKLKELGFEVLDPERAVRAAGPLHTFRITANPGERTEGVIGCAHDLSDLSRQEKELLKGSGVLLSTLYSAGRTFAVRRKQTRIIVDEFSQVSPPVWFATLRRARSGQLNPEGYALLGDPYQLPVVTTQPLLQPNIGLFIRRHNPTYEPHQLELQHRMHADICAGVNSLRDALGARSKLETADHVRDRDLEELNFRWHEPSSQKELNEILDPKKPFVIVDTSRFGVHEIAFGKSPKNKDEANLAVKLAEAFYDSFTDKNSGESLKPMILSPYSGQVGTIRDKLPPKLKDCCTTIYKAQGREYSCVIVSFVRNDPGGFIGFLQDPQLRAQIYVACSRAKGKLVILLSRQCFVDHGHRDFDLLYQTKTANKIEL